MPRAVTAMKRASRTAISQATAQRMTSGGGTIRGVIAPTAALSAMPYMPQESMAALRHFYQDLGGEIWGRHGFVDAFNRTKHWVAESNLAIDQGPIVVMIENHRSGLLWDLFMSCEEVRAALLRLGFDSPRLTAPPV